MNIDVVHCFHSQPNVDQHGVSCFNKYIHVIPKIRPLLTDCCHLSIHQVYSGLRGNSSAVDQKLNKTFLMYGVSNTVSDQQHAPIHKYSVLSALS